jgi:hypothetical protein
MRTIVPVSYEAIRDDLRDGDVALCRGQSAFSAAIRRVTGGQYTHATMLGWASDHCLSIAETREKRGARIVPFSEEVIREPGSYDVFRPQTRGYRGDRAWDFMVRAAGTAYGWRHILRIWARRRLGWIVFATPNSDDPRVDRFCSELVHAALRQGGVPPVKTFDADVAPADLDWTPMLYLGTVFYSQEQIDHFQYLLTADESMDDSVVPNPFPWQ